MVSNKSASASFRWLGGGVIAILAYASPWNGAFAQPIPEWVCAEEDGCEPAPNSTPAPASMAPDQTRLREIQRQRRVDWATDEATEYARRGQWTNAISAFEEALDRDPDNEDIIRQLALARSARARALATAAAPVVAAPVRVAAPVVNTDASVVDTRGVPQVGADLLARVPQLAQSPAAESIRKGYQAMLTRDWPVALAWWQDALLRDPSNDAIVRSVELAQWMVEHAGPNMSADAAFAPALDAVSRGDDARAAALLRQLMAERPQFAGQAGVLLAALRVAPGALDPVTEFMTDPMYSIALEHLALGDTYAANVIFDRIAEAHARR